MEEKDIMDLIEMLIRIKDPNVKSETTDKNNSIYDYEPSDIEFVMEHAEQFIIPECIECCKLLWSKGIDTFQCGNYNDDIENGYWIEIETSSLSAENMNILDEMANHDDRVFFNEGLQGQHNYIIRVKRIDNPNASQELCDLADKLLLQDTVHYTTADALLDRYKRTDGELMFTETGIGYYEINPGRQNATLNDALATIEHPELYIAEEGRLYHNQHALNVHMNYLNKIGSKHL